MEDVVLSIRDLLIIQPGGVHAVRGVDFDVHEGESVAIIGSSGSGKSTVLRCINRLIEPTEGAIELRGEQINTPSEIANVTARAFHIAESGIPGPVVIAIPTDVLEAKVEVDDVKQIKINPPLAFPEKVVEVSNILSNAKKPVLVVGGQIHFSTKSRELVSKVAEIHNLPVLCTYEHQDIVSHNHPHYAGELGLRPPEPIRKNALEADVVLVVGHRFNGVPNMAYKFPSSKQTFIHVIPDPNTIGKIFRTDMGIVCLLYTSPSPRD